MIQVKDDMVSWVASAEAPTPTIRSDLSPSYQISPSGPKGRDGRPVSTSSCIGRVESARPRTSVHVEATAVLFDPLFSLRSEKQRIRAISSGGGNT
jgi:hypothetical protein